MGFFETLVTGIVVSAAMEILDYGGTTDRVADLAYEVVEEAGRAEYACLWHS